MALIRYDLAGTFAAEKGLTAADIAELETALGAAREEVLVGDLALLAGDASGVPADKQPLDAAFFELPEKILASYSDSRDESELGRILATAGRLRESVDRVVVLGIGGSYMGARALMEGCCHPYHNELSRGDRGSRPRMYFEGNNVDNDATQGLIDLLKGRDDWAIVVISKSGGTLETATAFRQFMRVLVDACGRDRLAERIVPVTGAAGKLFDLANAIGCPDLFQVPDGVGGRFSVLSPVGLLPAAILGIDIVRLLEGAVAMNEHFRTANFAENVVQQFVASNYLMDTKRNCNLRIMSAWSKSLESTGLWYDQLMAESLGKHELGATPLTVVNTRDLHSRAQQHQEGARDKFILNLITEAWRRDALPVGSQELNQDELNVLADRTLPEIMTAAIKGTNKAYLDDGRPTADLYLPSIDEFHLGQLFQMLMIATVVEGRLMKINPYGQPGVEGYKVNMKKELGI